MPFSSRQLFRDAETRGDWVTPHVELVERLAEGAMGELWRGFHHTLVSPVAVKVILAAYREDRGMLERFHMEAIAAARVKHPNVVQIYDHGATADGTAYIVMELFEGETLRQRIDRRGPIAVTEALAIAEQLAAALDAVHEQGVVHRDVKPDNVALVDTSRGVHVKLFDFGVASLHSPPNMRRTEPGTLLGTPAYMSVEQMLAIDEVDHRTDVWALAVVVYEMLTGELPFDDRSLRSACAAITAGRYHKPTERLPSLGGAVDEWFARAIDPRPENRYQSSSELIDALEAVLRPARDTELCRTLPSPPVLAGLVRSTLRSAGTPAARPRGRSYVFFGALAAVTSLSWSFYPREQPVVLEGALAGAADRTSSMTIEQTSIVATNAGEAMPPSPLEPPAESPADSPPPLRAPRDFGRRPQLPAKDLGF